MGPKRGRKSNDRIISHGAHSSYATWIESNIDNTLYASTNPAGAPARSNRQPVKQGRRTTHSVNPPRVNRYHHAQEDGIDCDLCMDREQQPWDNYYTFLAADLARYVISVDLDDPSRGQACFCVVDFSADDDENYIGIRVDHFVQKVA